MAFPPSTLDELLELWRSLFPRGFTSPIESEGDGQGLDAFAQQAAQFARVSDALNVTTQAYYLRPHSTQTAPESQGEARATGVVEVSRAAPATGAITLAEGTQFVADVRSPTGVVLDGVLVEVVADTLIPAGFAGATTVPVRAVRAGYQGNVLAGSITRFAPRGRATVPSPTVEAGNVLRDSGVADRLTLAMVGQYVRLVGGANGGTVPRRILSVTQGSPTSFAVLDGAPLVFPDVLTQVEVEEFGDLGLSVSQPSDLSGGRHGWLDAIADERRAGRQPGETDAQLRLRLSFLEDVVSPAAIERIAARLLDPLGVPWALEETRDPLTLVGMVWDFHAFDYGTIGNGVVFAPQTRFFVLRVGLSNAGEFGFAYDTPFLPRPNAWDVGAFDGYPATYYAALAALWQTVNEARAAGVAWQLVRDPTL